MDRGNGEVIDLNRIPAKVIQDSLKDPASSLPGMPPNLGRMVPPHIYTVQGRVGTIARVYRNADEAIRDNIANARYMRNECGIMECLEARQRGTALLKWHLAPEDEKNPKHQDLAEKLTQIIERVPQFVEMRRNLLEALWYGKYGVAYRWGNRKIRGVMRKTITHWEPRNGDKLVFRYEDGELKYDDRQVGIRVGAGYQLDISAQGVGFWSADARHKVEPTDQGLAYFFDKWERDNLIAIHKHIIEDGSWEDPIAAGAIHGVGIRSRIYATWFSMQELLGYLMEYVERAAAGVEIWPYEYGNSESEDKTRRAAEEHMVGGRSIILMPVYRGENSDMFRVEHIEPGLGGVESLKSLIIEFLGHKIKRYILGQIGTSEAEPSGLGSGVAEAHKATYSDVIRYDARKLEETLTTDLVEPLKNQNVPSARDVAVRFVIDTESDEMQEKLEAYERAWNMGLKIKAEDVASMIGASDPGQDDEVLENPQIQQAAQMGAMGGVGFAGPEGGGQMPPGEGEPSEGPEPEPAKPLAPEPVPPEEEEPEPYEATKERVIHSTGGGEDPFSEVVERKKLGRYALAYQDQPNGIFACFNCRWRDRGSGWCSLYCHLNQKYAKTFELEEPVDADAWCELHTEPGAGNLVRIEKYAAAAGKWEESKHPREPDGKFGSGGGGGTAVAEKDSRIGELFSSDDLPNYKDVKAVIGEGPFDLSQTIDILDQTGLDEVGSVDLAHELTKEGKDTTDAGAIVISVFHQLSLQNSAKAAAENLSKSEGAKTVLLTKPGTDNKLIAHVSVQEPEKWQLTTLMKVGDKENTMMGHANFDSLEDAIRSASGDLGHMRNEGDTEYIVTWTDKSPEKAPFSRAAYAAQMGLFKEGDHPRDEGGQFTLKPEGAAAAEEKPRFEFPTATIKGAVGEVEVEWKEERGMTFWRKAGHKDLGWTAASAGISKQIEQQKRTPEKAPKPNGISEAVLRGDTFVLPDGSRLPEHIPRIPPAWKNVRVSLGPNAPLLVSGTDVKGRRQSIYSGAHSMRAAAAKFAKISELAKKRQVIAQQVAQSRKENNEAADVALLVLATGLRPGSDRDTKAEKKAYGATTLLGKHVIQTNEGVRLKFTGKKGVEIDVPVNDRDLAAMLLLRKSATGDDGRLFTISDTHLREYVSTLNGGGFRPKDFRTLKGTSLAADMVRGQPAAESDKSYKKQVREIAKAVASKLGNTPTIALQSYIDPTVFAAIKPQAA